MSDIRKLLDTLSEMATTSGSVASVASPMGGVKRRPKDSIFYEGDTCSSCHCDPCKCDSGNTVDGSKAPDAPKASTFGNWQNSTLAGKDKPKKKSLKEASLDYGAGQRSLKLAEMDKETHPVVKAAQEMWDSEDKKSGIRPRPEWFADVMTQAKKLPEPYAGVVRLVATHQPEVSKERAYEILSQMTRASQGKHADIEENVGGMRDRPGPEYKNFDMAEGKKLSAAEKLERAVERERQKDTGKSFDDRRHEAALSQLDDYIARSKKRSEDYDKEATKRLEKDLDRIVDKELEGGTGEHHRVSEWMDSVPGQKGQTKLKRVNFKKGLVQELDIHQPTHEDDDMAKNQVHTIRRAADELEQIIQNDAELPQWIHSKITIAKDYLDTVQEYLMSAKEREIEQRTGEEGIELDEVITPDTPASDVIHDFVHSKNKMFKGDSKKERIKRALGAYYGMKRGR